MWSSAPCCIADSDYERTDLSLHIQTQLKGRVKMVLFTPVALSHFASVQQEINPATVSAFSPVGWPVLPWGPSLRYSQLLFSLHFGKPMWLIFGWMVGVSHRHMHSTSVLKSSSTESTLRTNDGTTRLELRGVFKGPALEVIFTFWRSYWREKMGILLRRNMHCQSHLSQLLEVVLASRDLRLFQVKENYFSSC